jgi:hypothetical protein
MKAAGGLHRTTHRVAGQRYADIGDFLNRCGKKGRRMLFRTRCSALFISATLGAVASALFPQSAHAQALTFTCGFTQAEIDLMNRANAVGGGYAMNPGQRFNFRIDMAASTAVDLSSPDNKYPAKVTTSEFSWSLPADDDGNTATFSLDRAANLLTSVDPDGEKTLWDCTQQ